MARQGQKELGAASQSGAQSTNRFLIPKNINPEDTNISTGATSAPADLFRATSSSRVADITNGGNSGEDRLGSVAGQFDEGAHARSLTDAQLDDITSFGGFIKGDAFTTPGQKALGIISTAAGLFSKPLGVPALGAQIVKTYAAYSVNKERDLAQKLTGKRPKPTPTRTDSEKAADTKTSRTRGLVSGLDVHSVANPDINTITTVEQVGNLFATMDLKDELDKLASPPSATIGLGLASAKNKAAAAANVAKAAAAQAKDTASRKAAKTAAVAAITAPTVHATRGVGVDGGGGDSGPSASGAGTGSDKSGGFGGSDGRGAGSGNGNGNGPGGSNDGSEGSGAGSGSDDDAA
jgi:hypothetical protein